MQITLYNSKSEKNRLNKDEYLHEIIQMTGTLREACSVSLPSIVIELDPSIIQQNIFKKTFVVDDSKYYVTKDGTIKLIYDLIAEILTCNYVYIKEFNRYYYVTDIISLNRNLWRLNMHVDVLMSFKENIYDINAFITRNEFEYNNLIVDDLLSYEYDKEVNEMILPLGDKVDTFMQPYNNPSIIDTNYTISVINTSMNNSISPEVVNSNNKVLNNVGIYNVGASLSSETYATYYTMINRLYRELINNRIGNVDLDSYVLSCICYPFTIKAGTEASKLKLGNTELTDVDVYDLNKKLSEYYTIADFTITADDN
ncbi:MAG: hypothetical protein PUG55_04985, partial [Bacillales bacterium]|nr:hypothetical protein [Bacillales bacterium]